MNSEPGGCNTAPYFDYFDPTFRTFCRKRLPTLVDIRAACELTQLIRSKKIPSANFVDNDLIIIMYYFPTLGDNRPCPFSIDYCSISEKP